MNDDDLARIADLRSELDAALRVALAVGLRRVPVGLGDALSLICDECPASMTIPIHRLWLEHSVSRIHLFIIAHRHTDEG